MRSLTVYDATADCFDGKYQRKQRDPSALIIHRCGRTVGETAAEVARFFAREGREYTAGNMPYTYVVTHSLVEQGLPLDERGAHAQRWGNAFGIGIAIIGDWNRERPNSVQWSLAVRLCAELLPWLAPRAAEDDVLLPMRLRNVVPVYGHGELPHCIRGAGEKRQPDGAYACPGRQWDMDDFREEVAAEDRRLAAMELHARGHRLTGET